jgi:hypothetical protein
MDLTEKPYLNVRFHAPDVQCVPEEVLEEAPPVVPVRIIRALPVHYRLTIEYAIRAVQACGQGSRTHWKSSGDGLWHIIKDWQIG